ncbi:DUF4440 domain-containing protein [Olivibacter sp. SDN3]|uniref:DUF4440 domain-containing protein n=1 Tax=Olivibacter sp. SDN3 TaxID=2764720 RepID=UPI001651891B|nr:DUF4440 domain-containing protein [Olivibacter sp. SDN3]QNL51274.1 DUF4440 domain-containing protein [Olivibacter sp. SDN3]
MLKTPYFILILFTCGLRCYAQQGDQEQINQLISAEYNMSVLAANRDVLTAYKAFSDENTIFFTPAPKNGLDFLKNKPDLPDIMSWKPVFAKVAKSDEWGFTTGPINWQRIGFSKKYGEYLCVWKRNRKGEWKIAYRAETEHGKPAGKINTTFESPVDNQFRKSRSKARLRQREDIILSTDQLFSTILKADNQTAFNEFLTQNSRLYLPDQQPVIGLDHIKTFLKKQAITIETTANNVDRAYSGELAYSNGNAVIMQNDEAVNCHYIRIWELQEDAMWKVIVEMYFKK